MPDFPFCSIEGISATQGGFFSKAHDAGNVKNKLGAIEWGGIFGLGNFWGLDQSTSDQFNNTQYGSFLW